MRARAGVGLVELLLCLVIMGILGVATVRLFLSQTRFADMQQKKRSARTVSRASINFLMSEARMVETGNGVAAASAASGASSITLRVPIAMGVVCGTAGGTTVLSMLPTDSLVLAGAALSGYAYRGIGGAYSYTEGAVTVTAGGAATCTAANVSPATGGRAVTVSPAFPSAAIVGTPAFVYQRVKYSFATSAAIVPGRRGLFRTLEATGTAEELVAPFDSSSRFRFYRNNNDTSDVAVPPLGEIRGIELVLTGASESPRFGQSVPETAQLRTALFFVNNIK